jgi:hypothetical protein
MVTVTRDKPDDSGRDAGVDLAATLGGTGAALTVFGSGGGVVPALATAAPPPALVLAWRLAEQAGRRQQQNQQRVIEVAAECLGGLDILEARTAGYDERVELVARVLEAAGPSTLEEKVQALGRVLAEGVREEGDIDEAFALAATLDDLEGVHVLLLQYLAEHPQPPEAIRRSGPKGWDVGELQQIQPDVAALVEPAVAVLNRHGLVSAGGGRTFPGSGGPAIYSVAPLGKRCLFLLYDEETRRPEGA